jgi:hypothetical protein
MPLGDAANGGVATHLRDQVEVQGEQGGAQAHARGGHRRFAASVSCADHQYIELFGKGHHFLFYGANLIYSMS